jgi:hypothetical protein
MLFGHERPEKRLVFFAWPVNPLGAIGVPKVYVAINNRNIVGAVFVIGRLSAKACRPQDNCTGEPQSLAERRYHENVNPSFLAFV